MEKGKHQKVSVVGTNGKTPGTNFTDIKEVAMCQDDALGSGGCPGREQHLCGIKGINVNRIKLGGSAVK
jgi:hypothetical protein